MTLYLKYRPQTVSELDLVSVRSTITKLLQKESIPHAFLFAGPRGTGKTSSARILAKALNCEQKKGGSIEPCNECDTCRAITKGSHIDVIEMDAASSRGIDEIRALKQDIMLAPSTLKRKIYIIDEVHMLTTEAANALLKTLEEPPAHVVFILATTDPQKLPQTVISRLAIVNFHKASDVEIIQKLKLIAEKEKLSIEEEVFSAIAARSDGSFRDAVKTLDELMLIGTSITKKDMEERFGLGVVQAHSLLDVLQSHGSAKALDYIATLNSNGVEGKAFLNSFMQEVHAELLKTAVVSSEEKPRLTQQEAISLLELLLEAKARMPFSINDFLPLQIALLKFKSTVPKEDIPKKVQNLPTREAAPKSNPTPEKIEVVKIVESVISTPPPVISDTVVTPEAWTTILTALRGKNISVESLLRTARPISFDGKTFNVGVYFKFHKEKLETTGCRVAFENVLSEIFQTQVRVEYFIEDSPLPVSVVTEPGLTVPQEPDIINVAKDIFGG